MDTNDETNGTTKIQYGGKLDPVLHGIIERIRIEEDRPFSNMIERLLKTHPRIQPLLEAETTTATSA